MLTLKLTAWQLFSSKNNYIELLTESFSRVNCARSPVVPNRFAPVLGSEVLVTTRPVVLSVMLRLSQDACVLLPSNSRPLTANAVVGAVNSPAERIST